MRAVAAAAVIGSAIVALRHGSGRTTAQSPAPIALPPMGAAGSAVAPAFAAVSSGAIPTPTIAVVLPAAAPLIAPATLAVAPVVEPLPAPEIEAPARVSIEEHVIRPRETLSDALTAEGFSLEQIAALVKAAKPFANLGLVRPGMTFAVWHAANPSGFGDATLSSLQVALAPNRILIARPDAQGFVADVKEIPYTTALVSYTGSVDSTLWDAAVKAKMDPNLIASLADVFAFDVDFNTEVRRGDRFRLVVEQKRLDGKPAGYGDILAAEYVNSGNAHQAIRFENAEGDPDYFAANGDSLRRLFLRSPLRYRRISSRFSSNRFHPVLHENRAHQGVDYAADVGTPIRAVGDGTVERSEWNGGSGNFVKLKHTSIYETSYSHLSGYGPGIKAGVKVRQGQIIGYVGKTGLATGPHLHFAFYEKGVYIDPLSKRFPAADPVPPAGAARFATAKATLLPLLPAWPVASDSPKVAGVPVHPAVLTGPKLR